MIGSKDPFTQVQERWGDGVVDKGFKGERGYIAVPKLLRQARRLLGISPLEQLLIEAMEGYRWTGNGSHIVFPRQVALARDIGASPEKVRTLTNALVEKGLIERHERLTADGRLALAYTRNGLDSRLAALLASGELPIPVKRGARLTDPRIEGSADSTAPVERGPDHPVDGGPSHPVEGLLDHPVEGAEEEPDEKDQASSNNTKVEFTRPLAVNDGRTMSPDACVKVVLHLWKDEHSPDDIAVVRAWAERNPTVQMADLRQKLNAARAEGGEPLRPLRLVFDDDREAMA